MQFFLVMIQHVTTVNIACRMAAAVMSRRTRYCYKIKKYSADLGSRIMLKQRPTLSLPVCHCYGLVGLYKGHLTCG